MLLVCGVYAKRIDINFKMQADTNVRLEYDEKYGGGYKCSSLVNSINKVLAYFSVNIYSKCFLCCIN